VIKRNIAREAKVDASVVQVMYQDLKKRYGDKYISSGGLGYQSPDFARIVGHAMDIDQDGRIHLTEYIRFLLILNSKDLDQSLRELFEVFDSDKNGYISRGEVARIFTAADEMLGRVNNTQRAENFFNKVDTDHDNRLSREEFVLHAKKDPSIMKDLDEIRSIILCK